MSVTLICPSCGASVTMLRPPMSYFCPKCDTAWPEHMRLSAEASLARQNAERPVLLTIGMYLSSCIGVSVLLLIIFAAFDLGEFPLNGESVSGKEFLEHAGLLYAMIGGTCVAAGYAIWQNRTWSRWPMVGFWLVQLSAAIGLGLADGGIAKVAGRLTTLLPFMFVAGWYLFDKQEVVAYYQALDKEAEALRAVLGANRREGE